MFHRFGIDMSRSSLILVLGVMLISTSAFAHQVTWHVVIKGEETTGDILTETLEEGSPLVLTTETKLPLSLSHYEELWSALSELSVNVPSGTFQDDADITLYIGPYTPGQGFPRIGMARIFLCFSFKVYIRGDAFSSYDLDPGHPLTLTIPRGNGLTFLLDRAGLNESADLMFAFRGGASFTTSGISTRILDQEIRVTTQYLTTIFGSEPNELGLAASVRFRTWQQIKLLFR